MQDPAKFREYAEQCKRLAQTAGSEKDRKALLEALSRPSSGGPLKPNGWDARYTARRLAWHALDHTWEIEDRST